MQQAPPRQLLYWPRPPLIANKNHYNPDEDDAEESYADDEDEPIYFLCPFCSDEFLSETALHRHMAAYDFRIHRPRRGPY